MNGPSYKAAARRAHNQVQQQAFDDIVASFEQPIPEDVLQCLELVVNKAQIHPGEAVLDIGTGIGVLIPFILKHHPSRVVACDLSGEMLKRVRARFGDRVTTLQADVVDIPLEQGPVGVVFCNAVFGNVYDQRETLEAIGRLLAPGGRLAISHPMGSAFVRRLKESSPRLQLKELPDEDSLRRLLEGTGLALAYFSDGLDLYLAICVKAGQDIPHEP
ncbi:MAG: Methyltransferase type 11 [Dehalococcoidia bacterium]|nr:Methyltransferase type 11 [Dehalococcoidia bacterium]